MFGRDFINKYKWIYNESWGGWCEGCVILLKISLEDGIV